MFKYFSLSSILFLLSWHMGLLHAQSSSDVSNSSDWEIIHKIEESYSQRISPFVKQIDEQAIVVVQAQLNSPKKSRLPQHPFDFSAMVAETNVAPTIRELKIVIYSQWSERFNKEFEAQTKKLIGDNKARVIFSIEKSPANHSVREAEKNKQEQSELKNENSKWASLLAAIVGAALLLVLGLWASGKGIQKTIQENTQKFLGQKENEINSQINERKSEKDELVKKDVQDEKNKGQDIASKKIEESGINLSYQGLIALMSDCYWCERDSESKYYWQFLGLEDKTKLLQDLPFYEDYLRFLDEIPVIASSAHLDSSYISTINISQISNADLAEWCLDNPLMLLKISEMRLSSLPLKTLDKLALWKQAERLKNKNILLAMPSIVSVTRSFRIMPTMDLQGPEEEELLLKEDISDLQVMYAIPTLGWGLKLSTQELAPIFRSMSAKDIAMSWIGPGHVLEYLKKSIPDKKWSIIDDYLAKSMPSRKNLQYRQLCKKIVDKISNQRDNTNNKPLQAA